MALLGSKSCRWIKCVRACCKLRLAAPGSMPVAREGRVEISRAGELAPSSLSIQNPHQRTQASWAPRVEQAHSSLYNAGLLGLSSPPVVPARCGPSALPSFVGQWRAVLRLGSVLCVPSHRYPFTLSSNAWHSNHSGRCVFGKNTNRHP